MIIIVMIGTHGILSATPITGSNTSEFHMKIAYYNHSNTRGALLNIVFITNDGDVDFAKSALLPLVKEHHPNGMLPQKLYHSGHYKIHVYDIEYDGTLSNGVGYPAASTDEIPIDRQSKHLLTSKMIIIITIISKLDRSAQLSCSKNCSLCDILGFSNAITIECKFLSDSMATGIQVIAQLSDTNEVHKLYINQNMDLQTPVTVPVERAGEYQVSIFFIREGMGILNSTVEYAGKVTVGDKSGKHAYGCFNPACPLYLTPPHHGVK